MKNSSLWVLVGILVLLIAAYVAVTPLVPRRDVPMLDAAPQNVTLSGTYGCLPHMDTSGAQTTECAFGLRTDSGDWYGVNFGASAAAADQFQSGVHVRVEGTVVIKEALNSDHWQQYNMKGIFTVTNVLESSPGTSSAPGEAGAKINIEAVCDGALAYMTFPNGDAASAFVADCKAGKHPEVIERYKANMNIDGATI